MLGRDRLGRFEIFRRYSDFAILRECFMNRWPGMYIPPIPPKKTVGNMKNTLVEERCFALNLFVSQVSRCLYLVESEEFEIFTRPTQVNIKRELSLLPRLSPENLLNRF